MRLIILSMLFLSSLFAFGQNQLQSGQNRLRSGDRVVKQQLVYKDPGLNGEGVLWDVSRMETVNAKYRLSYGAVANNANVISGTEHNTRYYYRQSDDSVLICGYENNTTKVSYDRPEVFLVFPMKYGDKTSGWFDGTGSYCEKYRLRSFGTYATEADALGMLILPDGDTLRNVIRVHTVRRAEEKVYKDVSTDSAMLHLADSLRYTRDSVSLHLQNDSNVTVTGTYRWYAAGYRYPVFETVITSSGPSGRASRYTTSYYYPPSLQTSLVGDTDNAEIRIRTSGGWNGTGLNKGFTYNLHQDADDGKTIHAEFYIDSDASVSCCVYSSSGATMYRNPSRHLSKGTYEETVQLSNQPPGVYLLTFTVDGNPISRKITVR